MFPFSDGNTVRKSSLPMAKEYEIDFEKWALTGRIVTRKKAVAMWACLALSTARYRFLIYSWEYGNELETLIGSIYSTQYVTAECKRMVEECLSVNPYIEGISDFQVELTDDKLIISFTLNTIYGDEGVTMNV